MPLERRIRDELRQAAERIEPNVERNLGVVETRSRRGRGSPVSLLLAAAIVLAVAVTIRLNGAPGPIGASAGPSEPSPSPSAIASRTPASYPEIAGTYVVTLDASVATVARDGLAGEWTLRLQPDGVALLSAPAGFQPGAGSLTGITFSLSGDRFRTDLFYNDFCSSIGTYAWSHAQGPLTFTPVDETCAVRRTLLSAMPWEAAP